MVKLNLNFVSAHTHYSAQATLHRILTGWWHEWVSMCIAKYVYRSCATALPSSMVIAESVVVLHSCAGLQLVDDLLASLSIGHNVTEAKVDHVNVYTVRSCLVLRVLLLETRQQLSLLSSNFAAAKQDAAENIQLLQRFPNLLVSLQPSMHLQAGLYAQAIGAYDAAAQHFNKAAAAQDEHMQVCARCFSALSYLAERTPDAGK